jgi:hypothetical protein
MCGWTCIYNEMHIKNTYRMEFGYYRHGALSSTLRGLFRREAVCASLFCTIIIQDNYLQEGRFSQFPACCHCGHHLLLLRQNPRAFLLVPSGNESKEMSLRKCHESVSLCRICILQRDFSSSMKARRCLLNESKETTRGGHSQK